jgi:uncharacterized membrane protein
MAQSNGHGAIEVRQIEQTSFSGPVPPPELLQGYERIEKGLASRIVAMAEENGRHIRFMEKASILGTIFETLVGQLFGFGIALAFLYGGVHLSMNGHPVYGLLTSTSVLLGLVGVFIHGRSKKSEQQSAPAPGKSAATKKDKQQSKGNDRSGRR